MSQGLERGMPFLKSLIASHSNLGPLIASRHPIFSTPSGDLDIPKLESAVKALSADPPISAPPAASTLGGTTNLSGALTSAMAGDLSGTVTSGAMALGMDMPVAIASGVGSILSMEWSILSGIGGALGSGAKAGLVCRLLSEGEVVRFLLICLFWGFRFMGGVVYRDTINSSLPLA